MKHHLIIIIAVAVGFGSFMLGYSLPPFMEVGFGGGENIEAGAAVDTDTELMQQYEDIYKDIDE